MSDVLGDARGELHNFGYGSPTTMVVEATYEYCTHKHYPMNIKNPLTFNINVAISSRLEDYVLSKSGYFQV